MGSGRIHVVERLRIRTESLNVAGAGQNDGEFPQRPKMPPRSNGVAGAHPNAIFFRDGTVYAAEQHTPIRKTEHNEVCPGQYIPAIGRSLDGKRHVIRFCHHAGEAKHTAKATAVRINQAERSGI